jgi:hypothetical protein
VVVVVVGAAVVVGSGVVVSSQPVQHRSVSLFFASHPK